MSNSDRVVLALGGAGTVGSGIVKALLDKGKPAKAPPGHTMEASSVALSGNRIETGIPVHLGSVSCTWMHYSGVCWDGLRAHERQYWPRPSVRGRRGFHHHAAIPVGHCAVREPGGPGCWSCAAAMEQKAWFKVAVISRDRGRLERLRTLVSPSTQDKLTTVVGDVGSEEGAEQAKQDLLKAVGKVTDIVSSLGFSWWQGGPPHTQSLKDLTWVIETLLLSTFVSWKAFFPLVRDEPSSTYSFITGGAGDKLLMPGTGFLTVGAASALAFCQVLRDEYPQVPCKLNQVKINAGVAPPERMVPGYLSNLDLGEAVASLVERRSTSHSVFTVSCPADLKSVTLERSL
ncbi:uncharacterized protein AB9W97_011712 isoform 2-T2 [Spinachia spinachia]